MAHKILFIAPLPPPVHGSAMVSQYIKESKLIQGSFDCDFVNLSTSRTMDEIGKGGIKKLWRFVGSWLTLLGKLLTHRYDLCYIAITCHGMGFLKDAPFALLCKLFGRKLLLHQHNKGMSRDCDRWPYRWLMPMVYRNATVMLLSWHLYPDIEKVVKREQVVVCPNGVPPLDNENLAAELRATINVERGTRGHACVYDNVNENDNLFKSTEFILGQQNLDTNLDTFTHTQACAGLPDEDTQSMYDNENDNENLQSMTAINQRPEGAINRAEHFNRSGASLTGTEGAYSTQNAAPRLLMLSNLIESKGIYVLLEACQRLKERGIAFHCDYVGGESKLISGEAFRKAITERGLEDCVTYHGPQYGADKDRAFRRADIFVFPTFYDNECFPLVLVEAMQYSLPIVTTCEGGIADIVTDGVNGLVCRQQDVESLVESLTTLLADATMRREMGARGHQRYLKEMTLEAFEKRFAEALRSIC